MGLNRLTIDQLKSKDLFQDGKIDITNNKGVLPKTFEKLQEEIQKTNFSDGGKEDLNMSMSGVIVEGNHAYYSLSEDSCLYRYIAKHDGSISIDLLDSTKESKNKKTKDQPNQLKHVETAISVFPLDKVYIVLAKKNANTSLIASQIKNFLQDKKMKTSFFVVAEANNNSCTQWLLHVQGAEEVYRASVMANYKNILDEQIKFSNDCKGCDQIIKYLKDFMENKWNLETLQTVAKLNGIKFLETLSKIESNGRTFHVPARAAKIYKCLTQKRNNDFIQFDSSFSVLEKIKTIVAKAVSSIMKSYRIETLSIESLENIKKPNHKLYAALYLAFKETELGKPDFVALFLKKFIDALQKSRMFNLPKDLGDLAMTCK